MREFFAAMAMALALASGVALILDAKAAQAAAISLKTHTSLRHYVVSGADELSLLREMRRKGPRVGGKPALASTRMQTRYTARMRERGAACRVEALQMEVRFIVTLPALHSGGSIRRTTRRRWPSFVRKLRRHENRHIAIWMDCLRQVKRTLPTLRAADCRRLRKRMRNTYQRIMRQCSRRHDAFDRREKHAAASLPFIKAAFGLAHGRAAR